MPFTYTNRKGTTYTLYRKTGIDGKTRYVFGRDEIADGEPVDKMPPGFRVSESPNGIVSVARDRPALIRPDEIAAVERELRQHPRARDFRLVVKQKHIEIYAKIGEDAIGMFGAMIPGQGVSPENDAELRELDDLWAQFMPVQRIALRDPERRTFAAQQRVSRWEGDIWVNMGTMESIDALAREVVPQLPTVSHVFVPPFAEPAIKARRKSESATRARKRSGAKPASIHQLKVTLLGSKPPIWRRIAVPSDYTLGEVHDALQLAMGWHNAHLHDFTIDGATYGDPVQLQELGGEDEWAATLARVAPRAKSRLRYMYDFGDSWEHDIVVEQVGPPAPDMSYPMCLAGKRACPPEDCGGVWGYADLLETLADPASPEHDDMLDWLGGPIDPETFDLETVNQRLARMR